MRQRRATSQCGYSGPDDRPVRVRDGFCGSAGQRPVKRAVPRSNNHIALQASA